MARARTRQRAIGAAFLLVLSGCEVGPDDRPPRTVLAPFHAVFNTRPATPAPPLDTWWTGFKDPELTRVIRRALDQNLDLAASLARVAEARAAAEAAGAQLLPTGTLTGQILPLHQSLESPIGRIARNFPGYTRNQVQYDLGIGASWEIDLFGGLRRGAEAASAEQRAAEADRLGTRVMIAADAADAYVQVRGDQARLEVARQQIVVNRHLLDLVEQRRRSGVGSDREAAQAAALLSQAEATVPPLRTALEGQLNRLDVLMGVQPGTYAAELAAGGEIPAIPDLAGAASPVDVLRRRPDIIAAEQRLAASNARIGAAIADYYPKISLSALLGFESLSAGQLFTSAAFQPLGTGALRWRLFDFGKVDAEVARARGENAEALARYRQTVLRAAEDVEDAFTALAQSTARTGELAREVAALRQARTLSQQEYEAGVDSITDVLDADRQLLAARDDLALTRADTARAAVSAFRALGGGWST